MKKLKEDLQKAYKMAAEVSAKVHLRNKKVYDRRLGFQNIQPGDRVLVRNLGMKGKHKLENRWNDIPYIVLEQLSNLPVYKLKLQNGIGKVKTLHRDNILPIGELVRIPVQDEEEEMQLKTPVRRSLRRKQTPVTHPTPTEDEWSSEYSDFEYVRPKRTYRTDLERLLRERSGTMKDDAEMRRSNMAMEDEILEDDHGKEEQERDDARGPDSESESDTSDDSRQEPSPPCKKTPTPPRPRRMVKPVVKLTYDQPGKSRDQPLTIVHRGITIHIGKT